MFKRYFIISCCCALVIGCGAKPSRNSLTPELQASLSGYLAQHGMKPVDYVVSKFADHDVVFLGEFHKIKQDQLFIQSLIPKLYAANVRNLAIEFARREDQPLIDSLLAGPTYNEALARQIGFQQFTPWGFQEYIDIFKAAWTFDHSLPPDAPRFRILGVNDSPDWSVIKTQADRDKDEIKRQVWRGGGEKFWADVILAQVSAGNKVCVYSGIHHAFSEYKQPIVDGKGKFIRFEEQRMGNFVYRAIGKRAITIYLHAPWVSVDGYDRPLVRPVGGIIDELMAALGPNAFPVAFDTKGTPFGALPAANSVYSAGYDAFKLENFADGYIFQVPFDQMIPATPVPDWYNESNLDAARQQVPNPDYRNLPLTELRKRLADDANSIVEVRRRMKP
jgi:hypothetical protein